MERKRNKIHLLIVTLLSILGFIIIYLNHYLIQKIVINDNEQVLETVDILEVEEETKEEVIKESKKDEYIAIYLFLKLNLNKV